jgi:hypothetical protein
MQGHKEQTLKKNWVILKRTMLESLGILKRTIFAIIKNCFFQKECLFFEKYVYGQLTKCYQ